MRPTEALTPVDGNTLTLNSQFNPSDPFSGGEVLSGGSQIRIVESFVDDDDELVTITVEFSK